MELDPFISTEDLSAYLRKDTAFENPLLASIAVNAGCEIVRDYVRQQLNYIEDDAIRVSGLGTKLLMLPELPSWYVSTVAVNDEELDPEDYFLGDGSMLWRNSHVWPIGQHNISITYSHGFSISNDPVMIEDILVLSMPASIRMIALEVAARIYDQGLASSETIGQMQIEYLTRKEGVGAGLTKAEMRVLDRYRSKYRKGIH